MVALVLSRQGSDDHVDREGFRSQSRDAAGVGAGAQAQGESGQGAAGGAAAGQGALAGHVRSGDVLEEETKQLKDRIRELEQERDIRP
ncbi:hypothetical protein GCM10022224_041790 [Nonomuraea antimicrobica]|uniref:Uncharacterized protein n=1 Tax=Nonomuraea antimicrobica TaxID=561173 RepID=A0ABP7C2A4_9ACTN